MDAELFWICFWVTVSATYFTAIRAVFFDHK